MSEIKVMNNDEIRDFCIKKDLKIFELEQELQQKENIIKEVRKYVKQLIDLIEKDYLKSVSLIYIEKILEILEKENK